jgi:nicotinate-nucleotide adenylyltransferase
MRIGIMGGTFDPIHNGHLFVAEEARVLFALERILFIPNGNPPHKKAYELTSADSRYAMTELATRSNPAFTCSPLELNRGGRSYTVDTLLLLHEDNPDAELFYITGVDAVADILTWKRHNEVIRLATFIAAARPGYNVDRLQERLPAAYLERILRLDSTALGISSTDIRERVSRGLPIRYLTPDGVVDYIDQHRLYADATADAESASMRAAQQGEQG